MEMVGGGPERVEQPRDDQVRLRPRPHVVRVRVRVRVRAKCSG